MVDEIVEPCPQTLIPSTCRCKRSICGCFYLTLSVFSPNCPQPSSGGVETRAVMNQMVMMVISVESGVLSGNWRSLVTIMNLENTVIQ